jgi:hypothetical protein
MNRQSSFVFPFPIDTTFSHRNSLRLHDYTDAYEREYEYDHPAHLSQEQEHGVEMDPNSKVGVWMNNSDPTGEFMYQMPPAEMGAGMGGKGDAAPEGSQLE